MDISYESEITKQCFKCDQTVLKNLNIAAANNLILLWNKFQIFVYENIIFETAALILYPEFQIHDVILSGNYIFCLDSRGSMYTTSLQFNNSTLKRIKYGFFSRARNIVASSLFEEDYTLCLKLESNSYFLCLHQLNTKFYLTKHVILIYKEHLPNTQSKSKPILKTQPVKENHLQCLKKVFNLEDLNIGTHYKMVVATFDQLDIYGCLFSPIMIEEEASLVKLYSCPSEICNIHVTETELNIVISLSIGTMIVLTLGDLKCPQIIHLNTAVHRFLSFKDMALYTDGKTMWLADNITKEIKFKQFFVKHVKDFVKIGDQIICTTYTNLIYKFSIDDDGSYLKLESKDEYCLADKVLNNSECLQKIMDEVKNNDSLIKTLSVEKNYITALSLSNRQDVMDSIINHKVIVYENYEDAITEHKKVILTNNISEYFDEESFFFLIKISTTTEHKLADILSNSLGDLRIHITLATATKIIRTISIKVIELLKKISFLIPLKTEIVDITEMNVSLKIMSNIPGAFDDKQKIWTILYRKNTILYSEHFIKFNLKLNRQQCLKNVEEPIEKLILQTAVNQYGNLFQFEDISRHEAGGKEWHMYVRLPDKYQETFRNNDHTKHLTSKKVNYFLQQFTSEEFLKSKSNLIFSIGIEKVKVEIYNDSFSSPLLKLSGANAKVVLNIRNFLSDLIYCVFTNFGPGKEFINLSSYSAVENLQKAVRKWIAGSSEEHIEPLVEQFERNVIGVLPI